MFARFFSAARVAGATVLLASSSAAAWSGDSLTLLTGSVSSPETDTPIVVVAIDRGARKVVHRVFLGAHHQFYAPMAPGRYKLYAFADRNGDGVRGRDEAVSPMYVIEGVMRSGEQIELPTLRIARQ